MGMKEAQLDFIVLRIEAQNSYKIPGDRGGVYIVPCNYYELSCCGNLEDLNTRLQ